MKKLTALALATSMASASAFADTVKIGYVTTLTTPAAIIGKDMENGVNLALEHLGGKAGSHDLEVIFADDGFAPETGKQVTDRLVKQDNVDFVAGYIWSHVLMASRKSVLDADKFLIISNAGASPQNPKTPFEVLCISLCKGRSVLLIVIHEFFLIVSKPLLFASVYPLALALYTVFADISTDSMLLSCFPLADILSTVSPNKRALSFTLVVNKVSFVLLAVSPLEYSETVHFIFRPGS